MQAIKCELCGSSDIMKQDGFFQCQNCGTKYSLEEARKLIGVVKIDKTEDVENLMTLARRYYNEHNYTDSERYFELALRDAPNNWEAHFFRAYCHALTASYSEAVTSVSAGTTTALKLIKDYLEVLEQPHALNTIMSLDIYLFNWIIEHIKLSRTASTNDVNKIIHSISDLQGQIEEYISLHFYEQESILQQIRESHYNIIRNNSTAFDRKERKQLLDKLESELKL